MGRPLQSAQLKEYAEFRNKMKRNVEDKDKDFDNVAHGEQESEAGRDKAMETKK